MRHVNSFLTLKYEVLYRVAQMFNWGDYFIIFNLKSGYYYVDINVELWQYLGFSMGHGSEQRNFYVQSSPLQVSYSLLHVHKPATATSEMLEKLLRPKGNCIHRDGICAASTKQNRNHCIGPPQSWFCALSRKVGR